MATSSATTSTRPRKGPRKGSRTTTDAVENGIRAAQAVTINRSPQEIYAFWRKLEDLPRFMTNLKSVTELDGTRSHWVVDAPVGSDLEWDAEITEDRPGEVIRWRSLPDADVPNEGEVRFFALPGDRGTVVRAVMVYTPPGGKLGKLVAKLFGKEPNQQMHEALHRLKQLLEVGFLTTTTGQPTGEKHPQTRGEPS